MASLLFFTNLVTLILRIPILLYWCNAMRDTRRTLVILILLTSIIIPIATATATNVIISIITGKHFPMIFNYGNGVQPLGDGDRFKFPWVPG